MLSVIVCCPHHAKSTCFIGVQGQQGGGFLLTNILAVYVAQSMQPDIAFLCGGSVTGEFYQQTKAVRSTGRIHSITRSRCSPFLTHLISDLNGLQWLVFSMGMPSILFDFRKHGKYL